jgi:hypothetical protein
MSQENQNQNGGFYFKNGRPIKAKDLYEFLNDTWNNKEDSKK